MTNQLTKDHRLALRATLAAATGVALMLAAVPAPARAASLVAGVVIWVSPDGDDLASGATAEPLATIKGARDWIRNGRTSGALGDAAVTVYLRGGSYRISDTVAFGPEDSGVPGARVRYSAAPGEDVRITGGPTLPSSAVVPVTDQAILARLPQAGQGQVVQIDLGALGIHDLGEYRDYGYGRGTNPAPAELFVNGRSMTVAAWPNEGEAPIGAVLDPGSNPSLGQRDNRGATFVLADPALSRWDQADQMFVSGFFWHGWAHDSIRVESVDTAAQTVTLASASQYSVRSGQTWSNVGVSNLLEEIDRPGEYFIDHQTRIAYLYPQGPLAGASIQLSLLDTPLLSLIDASHLDFTGLTFESARGMGVYLEGGQDVKIAGNTFQNLGAVALSIGQGAIPPAYLGDPAPQVPASNIVGALQGRLANFSTWNRRGGTGHEIVGNDVRDTGAGGILAGAGDRPTLTPSGIRIANNDVRSVNRWLTTSAPGIWINGAGILVEHNLVADSVQRALFVNGNLHVVRKNELYHAVRDADDVGAVGMYRDPSEFGNLFEHNFIHDNGSDYGAHGTQGIFLDDGTSGQIVRGNVFVRAGSNFAVKLHGGRHNRIENNIFVDTPTAVGLATWAVDRWKDQLNSSQYQKRLVVDLDIRQPPFSTNYPTLATYIGPDGRATDQPADSNVIANNVMVGGSSLASSSVATFGDNYVTGNDPGFANPQALDYTLDPQSVVYDELPNFQPIPFGEIGLFTDEFRPSTDPAIGPFALLAPAHGTQNVDRLAPPALTWQPADNAEGYRVQVAEDSTFSTVVVDERTTSTQLQLDGVLNYGKVYSWRVRAESASFSRGGTRWNSGGNRAFRTREVSVVPARAQVSLDDSTPGQALLTWAPVNQATEYRVLRRDVLDGAFREIHRGAVTTFTDAVATPLLDISYVVVAGNRLGVSEPSDPVSIGLDAIDAFVDDFADGVDPAWRDGPGDGPASWNVIGGDEPRLRLFAAGARNISASKLAPAPPGGALSLSAEIRVESFTGGDTSAQHAGLIAAGDGGSYRLSVTGSGEAILERSASQLVPVSAPHALPSGWTTLTIVISGKRVLGLVDGVPTLVLVDPNPLVVTGVGLAGGSGVIDFSDVVVRIPRWGAMPAGWTLTQYGPQPALARHDGGTWTVRASGADVWGTEDEFGFVYQRVSRPAGGRVVISARVRSLEQIASTTMAGVMIRAEDTPNAANVYTRTVAAGSNQTTIRRLPVETTGYTSVPRLGRPIDLRLIWEGATVTSYYRLDGGDWVKHTANEIYLPDEVLVGLAVSSHDPQLYTEAVFTDVELSITP